MGYSLTPLPDPDLIPQDLDERSVEVVREMQSIGALEVTQYTTYSAVEYVVEAGLDGDLIECGVYQGRQPLMMAQILKAYGVIDCEIYLDGTCAGQIKPTVEDYKDKENREASSGATLAPWEEGQTAGASKS